MDEGERERERAPEEVGVRWRRQVCTYTRAFIGPKRQGPDYAKSYGPSSKGEAQRSTRQLFPTILLRAPSEFKEIADGAYLHRPITTIGDGLWPLWRSKLPRFAEAMDAHSSRVRISLALWSR